MSHPDFDFDSTGGQLSRESLRSCSANVAGVHDLIVMMA
jgi:hypothetical protein